MVPRKLIRLLTWPDPLLQERLEDGGFFFDDSSHGWVRFVDADQTQAMGEWLKRHQLVFHVEPARGRGERKKHPRLSDQLLIRNGGAPTLCGLCGARGVPCRQWVEGDDTDSTDYPEAAKFYLCGTCVQQRMQPHPRLYAPAEDQL